MSDIKRFIKNWDYYYFGNNAPEHISGISLDKSEISFTTVWQTEQLTATIIPENPVETVSLNWSSSDTSIATVDNTWLVTCVTPWSCTITVTTTPWSYTASCEVCRILTYDFTTSDAWWNANWCPRDGWGFYRTNTWSDWGIIWPTEIFQANPKKITIVFNKVNQSSWTLFAGAWCPEDWQYWLPKDYNTQWYFTYTQNWAITNVWMTTPSWITTWEMNVDQSTTPRTVTHKITWTADIVETSWVLDYIWSVSPSGWVYIRIVNRSGSTGSMYIRSFAIAY